MTDKKISELDAAATLDGTELVPIVQSGETVRTTISDLTTLAAGGKEILTADRTYYVATTGSNADDGLTSGTAWLTPQYAANFIVSRISNPGGYNLTISVADGIYDVGAGLFCGIVDCNPDNFPIFSGNSSNPANVVFQMSSSVTGFEGVVNAGGVWEFDYITLDPNGFGHACGIATGGQAEIITWNCRLDDCGSGLYHSHFLAFAGGNIRTTGLTEIIGTANNYMVARGNAHAWHQHGELRLTIDPLWPGGTFVAERDSFILFNPDEGVTGTSSGLKYAIAQGSQLYLENGVQPPGATSGTVSHDSLVFNSLEILAPSFTGDSGLGGQIGYVPAPAAGDAAANKVLGAGGDWVTPTSVGTAGGSDTQIQWNNANALDGFGLYDETNHNIGLGTTAFSDLTSGTDNTGEGYNTGRGVTTGSRNTIIGANLTGLTTGLSDCVILKGGSTGPRWGLIYDYNAGNENLFIAAAGSSTLANNLGLTGYYNYCIGVQSGKSLTSGHDNVMIGSTVGGLITSADNCILIGQSAGSAITTSTTRPICIGGYAGRDLTSGGGVFIGHQAGLTLTTGVSNYFLGTNSGAAVTTGGYNVSVGDASFTSTGTGVTGNICLGYQVLTSQTGNYAIGLGFQALQSCQADYNIGIGYASGNGVTSGVGNILIGAGINAASYGQVTSGSHNVSIGYDVAVPSATASDQLCIQNIIYGTGNSGTGSTASTGKIGIGIKAPAVKLDVDGELGLKPVAFANVPGSPAHGMMVPVTDSSTATWGATITGGGTNKVMAFYNGTNWTVMGA